MALSFEFGGKSYTIDDKELATYRGFCVDDEEVISTWLDDNEITINAEQQALTDKAKESGILRTIHGVDNKGKGKPKSSNRKVNGTKVEIIAAIAQAIENMVDSITIRNPEKYIDFSIGGDCYELNLVLHRKPKK